MLNNWQIWQLFFLLAPHLTCQLSQYFGAVKKKNDKNLKYLLFIWLCMAPWQLRYESVPLNSLFLKYCILLKTIISKYVLLEFNCQVCHSNFTVFYDSVQFFGEHALQLMSIYFEFNTSFLLLLELHAASASITVSTKSNKGFTILSENTWW